VFIDGDNVVPGGLVLGAGQECDLERSIKNGNLTAGNKFKFVERTAAIENGPRGAKLEDGLIRIEFQFEKIYQRQDGPFFIGNNTPWGNTPTPWQTTPYNSPILRGLGNLGTGDPYGGLSGTTLCSAQYSASSAKPSLMNVATAATAQSLNDIGITVPGSKSDQKFATVSSFPTEMEKHTIVLKVLGETADNKPVAKPVTVKAKPKCSTCGKLNKATAKYCSECGTALELF